MLETKSFIAVQQGNWGSTQGQSQDKRTPQIMYGRSCFTAAYNP